MGEEIEVGCARPTGGLIGDTSSEDTSGVQKIIKEEDKTMIQVGEKAPDFTAPAYHNGKFVNVKLSEYFGKWILLCFYPGDFTFV